MSLISKTLLLGMGLYRRGTPFANVNSKTSIDSTNFNWSKQGFPYYGVGVEESVSYSFEPLYYRRGFPFLNETGNASIDASSFNYSKTGFPYYVYFGGEPPEPPSYLAYQFMVMF